MMTKEEKIDIFENTLSGLKKKLIPFDKARSDVRALVLDRLDEKFRRLPLD